MRRLCGVGKTVHSFRLPLPPRHVVDGPTRGKGSRARKCVEASVAVTADGPFARGIVTCGPGVRGDEMRRPARFVACVPAGGWRVFGPGWTSPAGPERSLRDPVGRAASIPRYRRRPHCAETAARQGSGRSGRFPYKARGPPAGGHDRAPQGTRRVCRKPPSRVTRRPLRRPGPRARGRAAWGLWTDARRGLRHHPGLHGAGAVAARPPSRRWDARPVVSELWTRVVPPPGTQPRRKPAGRGPAPRHPDRPRASRARPRGVAAPRCSKSEASGSCPPPGPSRRLRKQPVPRRLCFCGVSGAAPGPAHPGDGRNARGSARRRSGAAARPRSWPPAPFRSAAAPGASAARPPPAAPGRRPA